QMPGGPVTSERSNASDDDHRVVPFRRRGARARGGGWRWPRRTLGASPVEDLAKYEGGDEQDDNYRHRMMVNLAALGATIALAVAGVWLALQIADMRKNQDCVLSGRVKCAPVNVKALPRLGNRCTRAHYWPASMATCVSPEKPSTRAAAGVTSMTRPRTKGPRSLMVTITERPLLLFVTFTLVPNGSVRCAAVNAS